MASFEDVTAAIRALVDSEFNAAAVEFTEIFSDLPQLKAARATIADQDTIVRFYLTQGSDHSSLPSEFTSERVRTYRFVERHRIGDSVWTSTLRDAARETLKSVFRSRARHAIEAESLVVDISEALGSLHAGGVVHGNFRPSRVLWTGSGWEIADFLPPATLEHSLDYIKFADRRYLAPELVADGSASPRPSVGADIYAFGAVVKELLAEDGRSKLRMSKRTRRRLEAVAFSCTLSNPLTRSSLESVRRFVLYQDRDLIENINSRDRAEQVRAIVAKSFRESNRASSWLAWSTPLHDAVDISLSWSNKMAENEPRLLLGLQNQIYHANLVDRLTFAALQGHDITEHVVRRHLELEERSPSRISRDIHPPDVDADWRERIFADHRRLLNEFPLNAAATDAGLEDFDRYSMSPRQVFDRLEETLDAANELRAYLLRTVAYLSLEDVATELESFTHESVDALLGAGMLLAISDHGQLYFPQFQFRVFADGIEVRPEIALVNAALGESPGGWMRLLWWISPTPKLDGRSPASLLGTEDESLIVEVARSDRSVD